MKIDFVRKITLLSIAMVFAGFVVLLFTFLSTTETTAKELPVELSETENFSVTSPDIPEVIEFAGENKMPVHVHSQIINPIGEERVRDPLLSPVLEYVFDYRCVNKYLIEDINK